MCIRDRPIAVTCCSYTGSINCISEAPASEIRAGCLAAASSRVAAIVLSSRRGVEDALEEAITAASAIIARTNIVARKAAECHRKRYLVETRGCRAVSYTHLT